MLPPSLYLLQTAESAVVNGQKKAIAKNIKERIAQQFFGLGYLACDDYSKNSHVNKVFYAFLRIVCVSAHIYSLEGNSFGMFFAVAPVL